MQVRSEKIFPVLIPRLIAKPITAFNARALAALVRVAGAALGRRLTHIVDALQNALETEEDEDTLGDLNEALTAVLASVDDHESGLGSLQMHMLSLCKHESPAKRITGCSLFTRFCQATEADFSDYTVDFIRQLVSLFDDRTPDVVSAAWSALDALVKKIDKEDMEPLVVPLRRTIESTGTPGVPVDGFSRPNGLKPILRKFPLLSFFSPAVFAPDVFPSSSQPSSCKVFSLVLPNNESKPLMVSEISLSEVLPSHSKLTAFKRSVPSVSSHSLLHLLLYLQLTFDDCSFLSSCHRRSIPCSRQIRHLIHSHHPPYPRPSIRQTLLPSTPTNLCQMSRRPNFALGTKSRCDRSRCSHGSSSSCRSPRYRARQPREY